MPTDAIAAAHQSIAGRTTCPPEDSRTQLSQPITIHHPSSRPDDAESVFNDPAQQPTPPAERELTALAHSPSESHMKPSDMPIEGPIRDIPTPTSAIDDSVDDQRNPLTSPLSATAPGPGSWPHHRLSTPHPNYRVRITTIFTNKRHELIGTVSPTYILLSAPTRHPL
jgi:glucose-induced degradation protein 4